MMQKNDGGFRTLPISEVHDTTIVLGMVVDSRMREVMLMGRLGLFGSTPFLVGGRYPCGHNQEPITYDSGWPVRHAGKKKVEINNSISGLTGRLQGLLLTFTHRLGGKWSSCGQLVSDKQNLEIYINADVTENKATKDWLFLNLLQCQSLKLGINKWLKWKLLNMREE